MTRQKVLGFVLVLGAVFALGCAPEVGNTGDVVGGPCVVSSECAPDAQCRTGEAFPMGMCGKLCANDRDCPEGSVCTSDGNFCMVSCAGDADCRTEDGYACLERETRGGPAGIAMVCATAP